MGRCLSSLMLFSLCCAAATPCHSQRAGQDSQAADESTQNHAMKWPLRLHVLAIDDTHKTVRMQPNWDSGSLPDPTDDVTGPSSSPGSRTLGGGSDDFSGAGRADLVTPPNGTAGLTFEYEGCSRVRVAPGFQGLEARWIKPGSKLQVMIPTEAVTDGTVPMQRCTLKVVTQNFVYLRLPNGAILRVSQEAYSRKPSLRMFLSGGSEALKRRAPRLPQSTLPPEG